MDNRCPASNNENDFGSAFWLSLPTRSLTAEPWREKHNGGRARPGAFQGTSPSAIVSPAGERRRTLGRGMRGDSWFTSTAFSVVICVAVACCSAANVRAQQADAAKFNQTYEAAFAKAREECKALWSDHAFDSLRDKFPLGEEKPAFSMLTNTQRLRPEDKPLADLAIKTLERCRAAYAPVYAMLPPQVKDMMLGAQRRQDALIAELYVRKITIGEYNVKMARINGEIATALSGIPQSSTTSAPAQAKTATTVAGPAPLPPSRPPMRDTTSQITALRQVRLALVIGDSSYLNLPRLVNPENDARAIDDLLKKIGFSTRLVLNASEQDLRREVRKFASESERADIALVFYAGHGAQVNGENYVLPVDIDIPRTESDIQLTGLKVDDLVNSIRARTKVVFLDACRDNPV
jgi:caspase domain-containing protein